MGKDTTGQAGGRGKKKPSGKLPEGLAGDTRDQIARYVGVSGRTLEKMAEVRERQRALARVLRDQKKTQAEVGWILGVAQPTIDLWESDTSNISDDNTCTPDLRFHIPAEHEEFSLL